MKTKDSGAAAKSGHPSSATAVAAMFTLNGALFGMWASRIPAFTDALQLDHATLGLLLLLLAAGAILSFPIAGRMTDKHGAALVTRLLGFANCAALILIAFSPGIATIAVALFLFGATHGAMDVSMNAWAAESDRASGKALMPVFHAVWSFGAGMGALSGVGAIAMDWLPLAQFGIVGVILTSLTLWLANIPWQSQTGQDHGGPLFPLPKGPLLLVGLLALCSTLGEGAMADWSAIYLRDAAGATEGLAAAGYAVFSAAMVCVRLSGAALTRALGPIRATQTSGAVALIGVLLIVGLATPQATLIGLGFLGRGYGLVVPLAFSRAANDPELPQAQAIARVATLSYGGMLLGPPTIGFLAATTSLRMSFGLLGVLALGTIMLATVLRPPKS
ncbi:Major Facilitator Superfamily protein [Shimia gijangensis]|uniref:Major Facilitator Superfamily protein n=1 Tax=Shimia gijangensis TaxID=1470563 RepID=A0A1M6GYH0_9RHOB|nr:MFS transporter [Shimia gijangensis]SHJ15018.1 Major Facilitator Superfamily protein [Shimia gijangensis]